MADQTRQQTIWWLRGFLSGLGVALVFWQASRLVATLGAETLPFGDFIEYWTAARLFLEGGNPYDSAQMLAAQHELGWTRSDPLMMWNPPWILPLIAPFSWIPFWPSRVFWFLANGLLVALSVSFFWKWLGGFPHWFRLALLVAFLFQPVLLSLTLGQSSILILAGVAGFAWASERRFDLTAGLFWPLIALKPHLLFPFWIFAVGWILWTRRWKIALGAAIGFVGLLSISLLWSPELIGQYVAAVAGDQGPRHWHTASTASLLRWLSSGPDWMLWAPLVVGIAGVVWMRARLREEAPWKRTLAPLLLLSVVTAPFAWSFDFVVLLPAALAIALRSLQRESWKGVELLLLLSASFAMFVLEWQAVPQLWHFWMPLLLGALYMAGGREAGGGSQESQDRSQESGVRSQESGDGSRNAAPLTIIHEQ